MGTRPVHTGGTAADTGNAAGQYVADTSRRYETILTSGQLDVWLKKMRTADLICFDTETTSLDPMQAKIVGMSFSVIPGSAAYLPLRHDYFDAPDQLDMARRWPK